MGEAMNFSDAYEHPGERKVAKNEKKTHKMDKSQIIIKKSNKKRKERVKNDI